MLEQIFVNYSRVHFIGVGGIGVSGLAELLRSMNIPVSGSDLSDNYNVQRLRDMGVTIHIGHHGDNVIGAELVVYSNAVSPDNVELAYAQSNAIPCITRGEMLAEITRLKHTIAIAGSHGKTTTSSLVGELLCDTHYDPTIIIGGRLNKNGNNAMVGTSDFLVTETDESDRSFLLTYPTLGVITNIDMEHVEEYSDLDDLKTAFIEFANRIPFYGAIIVCTDSPNVVDILPKIKRRTITYSIVESPSTATTPHPDIYATNIEVSESGSSFDIYAYGTLLGRFSNSLMGRHNLLNSIAGIACAHFLKIDPATIAAKLLSFHGTQRRLSVRYKSDDTIMIDDYGHHPTEIHANILALREAYPDHTMTILFQPHRYTRMQYLWDEFVSVLALSDNIFVFDIYEASEQPIPGITSPALVDSIVEYGKPDAQYMSNFTIFHQFLPNILSNADKNIIITFGAGSITLLSYTIAETLNNIEQSTAQSEHNQSSNQGGKP